MKLVFPLKDIMITPGQRIDLSETSEELVIEKIRKATSSESEIFGTSINK